MKSPHRYLLAGVVAMVAEAALAQAPDAVFERRFDVGEPIELDIASGRDSITIRLGEPRAATERGELHIYGDRGSAWAIWRRGTRLSDEVVEELVREFESLPPVELARRTLTGGHIDDEWNRGFSVDYEVIVPAETQVQAVAGSGTVSIEGISAPVEARSGSGSVSLRDIEGAVLTHTGSGSIRAENIAGDFEGSAGSGSIQAALAVESDVNVSTGSGRISLSGVDGALTARDGSGSITVDGRPSGAWALSSGSGRILLRVPPDTPFNIDARTGSGGVSTAHPVAVLGDIDRRRLYGEVRGGGSLISVRTGSGGVRIE